MERAPLMPKATAVWLVDNTSLTFEQIAEFCGLHPLEVKGIADGEVARDIRGADPIANGQLSRDEGLMPLEEVIRKSTSAVAARLGIEDRGLIREGMKADIVIFDPATVADRATYVAPHVIAAGVREVIVNGVFVVHEGEVTGAKPGKAIRHGR